MLPSFISSSGKGSGAGSRASAGVPWFSLAASASGSFSKPCTPGYRERMGWLVGEGRGSLGLVVGYLFLVHLRELLSQNPSSSCTVVAWENVSTLLIDLYSSERPRHAVAWATSGSSQCGPSPVGSRQFQVHLYTFPRCFLPKWLTKIMEVL